VTIIVGIKCKDAIVLASDSQMTYGTNKQMDGTKIETISFGQLPVLVAQSGDLRMSGRSVDVLRGLARNSEPKTVEEVGMIAQDAMRAFRNELRLVRFNCSSEELDESLRKQGIECEIMLGFFVGGKAHLLTVNLAQAVYMKSISHYEAIGCGGSLGQFLLDENTTPAMDMRSASLVAIYVVEIVKRHDAYCGGPTKVGIVTKDMAEHGITSVSFPQENVEQSAALLLAAEASTKTERMSKLYNEVLIKGLGPIELIDFDFDELVKK
jgi:20S proteasome alpha/beta subunit